MQRHSITPRRDWKAAVEEQGLIWHSDGDKPYWDESAYYAFTASEIELIETATETLINGLERLRSRAERDGDLPTERTATLKLAQLLNAHGELERGRGFLVAWIERDPRDAEPLYMLCDLDESIEHWDGVSAAATRLAAG